MVQNTDDGKVPMLNGATPKFAMQGPTVDDDIRRAIMVYGKKAVKEAVSRLTKPKRGRPDAKDWPELSDVIETDAIEWLNGGDPFSTRKDYSIAKAFADKHGGQSHPSTMKRIERKLAKPPYNRRWHMLIKAMIMTHEGYPFAQHIRALEELAKIDTGPGWEAELKRVRSDIAQYEKQEGAAPLVQLSVKEIRDSLARSVFGRANSKEPPKTGGLLDFLASKTNPISKND